MRPLVIDLFGGEGLAAYGYALAFAGRFRIVSVEASPRGLSLGLPIDYTREIGEQLIDRIDSGQGCE